MRLSRRVPAVVMLAGAVASWCAAPGSAEAAVAPVDGRVRLNSVGFTPTAVKRATIAAPTATTFRVLRVADETVALEGSLGPQQQTAAGDTNESVRRADFSALEAEGEYRLDIPGVGRSAPFRIGREVWNDSFRLVMRAFYLWRCGTEVTGNWQGVTHHHEACHLEDGWLDYVGGGHVQQDGTGGWHDAGDYNKYVVNAGVSVGLLFKAWEHFRERIEAVDLDLPESGNGVPDLLNELRWELEWLRKMQAPDGRVYHKLSSRDFGYWGVPEDDPGPRYFVPWGTTATADFVAMMALAARHFAEFDQAFADDCLMAARAAWAVLEANPGYVPADQTGFSTGAYEADDAVHRLWAAAEMWSTTGEAAFLTEFEERSANQNFTSMGPGWGDVRDLGLAAYLESESAERDPALVQRLEDSLLARATSIVNVVNAHAYGRGLGGGNWFWGANGSVAAQTFILHVANRLSPDATFRAAAEETLGFLFGRNYHNRSYVTGLGHEPPLHPHDRRGEPAWPGYVVGGGWPTGRDWVDELADFEQNEIAINWNASLAYALAAFAERETGPHYDWPVFTVGQAGAYVPQFDLPGPLTFTASGLPHWATFDPATGEIEGTPTDDPETANNDARRHRSVTLSVFSDDEFVTSRGVNLMVARAGSGARLVNLSARAHVGTGENVLIAGFVTAGSAPRQLLLRGIGPSLTKLNVQQPLTDSALRLYDRNGPLLDNDDWGASADWEAIRDASAPLGAFSLEQDSRDAVLFTPLSAGLYTTHVAGVGNATGVGLNEIYDAAPAGQSGELRNISARAWVGSGESVLIAGTFLSGGGSARVLVRGIGRGLSKLGVNDPLSDPVVTVYSGPDVLAINDDWDRDEPDVIMAAAAQVGAFSLSRGNRDAAVVTQLVDGGFTCIVSGKGGATGVALVELYLLPE